MNPLRRLRESLEASPVVRFGEYEYFLHPLADGIPPADPALVAEVVEALLEIGNFDCDKIVTAEAMGFPLAALLGLRTGTPYVFLRKKAYGLPGEVIVPLKTGYSEVALSLNYVGPGDRVVVVDDVVSTGGTLRAIADALRRVQATLVDILVVFDKMEDRRGLEEALGLPIHALLRVDIVEGTLVPRP